MGKAATPNRAIRTAGFGIGPIRSTAVNDIEPRRASNAIRSVT
jgi:hypothetical protein